MKFQPILFFAFVCSMFLFTACSSDSNADTEKEKEEKEDETFRDDDDEINIKIDGDEVDLSGLKESIDKLEDKLNEWNEEGKKEVVDFRKLKDMLPSKLAGMERTEHNGERAGALGFNISKAEAEYKDGDKRMEISVIDVGGIGAAVASVASWSLVEVDRESEDEYERSTTIDGYKAFEKYNKKHERGELSMIVDDRFVINVKGWGVSERDMRKARKTVDPDDLKKLAKK